jgi:hypothetical protein
MNRLTYTAFLLAAVSFGWLSVCPVTASAERLVPPGSPRSPPFTATLSNNAPLAFGMGVEDVSRALGEPLSYIRGRAGDEIYLAIRNIGGSGLINHNDRLYLQFRKGRLTGWRGDWGHNWMWQ